MKTINFFFPINCRIYEPEADDEYDVDQSYMDECIGDIVTELEREQPQYGETMVDFFDESESAAEKLQSILWKIEEIGGRYYGCVSCEVKEDLNSEETEALRDWITGQNSDGLGEGFEQRPFEVEDGTLYVSFWSSDKNYFVDTEQEFAERRHPIAIIPYSPELLRKLKDTEGLVILGCGGDRREWVRGKIGRASCRERV